jgi:hypothetical protein
MARTEEDFYLVKELAELGLSDYKIAALTSIDRSTVNRWRHRELPPSHPAPAEPWRVTDPAKYCYLLGCYLGDGHTTHRPPNGWVLRIACDRLYAGIVREIRQAMEVTFPERRATQIQASAGAAEVVGVCHPGIGRAFPQHGAGRKHLRPIFLADWQRELTQAHPKPLIRGLIHSDGCRAINQFHTKLPSGRIAHYSYVRYFFSNLSEDIRRIFAEYCELLGIRVTQSNHRNLTVSHRDSVALLEEFVGPKS